MSICFGHTDYWQSVTVRDLNKIHAVLQKDSIIPYVKALSEQSRWLNVGYDASLKKSTTVHSYHDYMNTLTFYVNGFKQPHLYLAFKNQFNKKIDKSFYIKQFKGKIFWIRLQNFEPQNRLQAKKLNQIIDTIRQYRNASYIIFDVRGNPGGNADYYRTLLKNLYGKDYLRSLGKGFLWNQRWHQIWRVSKENINALSQAPFIEKLQQAFRAGKTLYHEYWYILNPAGKSDKHNPVKAKIAILTDGESYSSAWLFTRVVLQLPNTVQLGQPTGINSYYSEPRAIALHHGLMLNFPMGANLTPDAHFGKRFAPEFHYVGDMSNDKLVMPWVLKVLKGK